MVRTYSGGMRRRLDLAASLMHRPDLLVLDEPTTGLDPGSRQQLWAILTGLKAGGTTMLLTTQYLEEADRFADVVHVLDHGKVIASGTPAQLKERAGGAGASLDDAFLALTGTGYTGRADRAGTRAASGIVTRRRRVLPPAPATAPSSPGATCACCARTRAG